MITLKHIGTFKNPYPGTRFYEMPDEISDEEMKTFNLYGRQDEFDELRDKADVLKGTMPDGTVEWAARMNFNGGQCDCCKGMDVSDFEIIEFYKEEKV